MAMDSMPITSNELGLKNRQQPHGYALLSVGAVAGVFVLLRLMVAESHPLSVFEWCGLGTVSLFALRRAYLGFSIWLSIVIDAVGPADVERRDGVIAELLLHRRIWTYQQPKGLVDKICYRFAPQFVFLTSPYRGLVKGIMAHLLLIFAAVFLVARMGAFAIPLLGVVVTAAVVRLVALHKAVRELPSQQPSVEVYEALQHLVDAGNPVDLYSQIRVAFEQLREKDFQNRTLVDRGPEIGVNAPTNKCTASLLVETQPMPDETGERSSLIVFMLDVFGVLLEGAGCGFLIFASALGETIEQRALLSVAAVVSFWFGSKLLLIAQRIFCTFRFRSDVIWLSFEGSFVLNKLAVGGGMVGLPATEGHSIKSDIHAYIRGTRLTSECAPYNASAWRQLWGTSQAAQEAVQYSPRYIVSAATDPVFTERLNYIVNHVLTYRDTTDQLRTPDLQSPDLQDMVVSGVQIQRLMSASAAQGAIEGQDRATGALPDGSRTVPRLPDSGAATPQTRTAPKSATPHTVSSPSQTPRTGNSDKSKSTTSSGRASPLPPPPPARRTQTTRAAPSPESQKSPRDKPAPKETVTWSCKKCGKRTIAPLSMAGQTLKCSTCGVQQIVPRSSS